MRMFGLTFQDVQRKAVTCACDVRVSPGDIIYITGASGSGKSVLLAQFKDSIDPEKRICLDDIPLPPSKAVIDCIDGDLCLSLKYLCTAGIGDVFSMLKTPVQLSLGQQYRFRLAQALASGRQFILADEFCSSLDDITAAVIAYKIRSFADSKKVTFILAGTTRRMLLDLAPEAIIEKDFSGPARTIYRDSYSEPRI